MKPLAIKATLLLAASSCSFFAVASYSENELKHEIETKEVEVSPKNLRSTLGLEKLMISMPMISFGKSTPTGEIDIPEQINNVESLQTYFDRATREMAEVDTFGLSGLEEVKKTTEKYRNEGTRAINDLLSILHKVDSEKKVEKGTDETNIAVVSNRRFKNEDQNRKKDDSQNKDREEDFKTYKNQKRRERMFYRRMRSDTRSYGKSHFSDIHEALRTGDLDHLESLVDGFKTRVDMHIRRRRMRATQELKTKNCLLLAECASEMSLYDLFIYFYSDDVTPLTGDVDIDQLRNDEKDIMSKQSTISSLAKSIKVEGAVAEKCDALLQQFHRTIEKDDAFGWEGGQVGEVCLAQGSTVYADLAGVVSSLHAIEDVADPNKRKVFENTLESMIKETLDCARDLFNAPQRSQDERFKNEEFVFSENPKNDVLDNYRFPYSTNLVDPQCDFVEFAQYRHYFSNANDIRIQFQGTVEQCKKQCCRMGKDCKSFDVKGDRCFFNTRTPTVGSYVLNKEYSVNDEIAKWSHYVKGKCDGYLPETYCLNEYDKRMERHRMPYDSKKEQCYKMCDDKSWCHTVTFWKLTAATIQCWLSSFIFDPLNCVRPPYHRVRRCNLKIDTTWGEIEKDTVHDVHGQLINKNRPFYNFGTYSHFKKMYSDCLSKLRTQNGGGTREELFSCVKVLTDAVSIGLQYVFGDRPSPGYVCGLKDAILANAKKSLPGYCCLDAPFQLDSSHWGNKYQCGTECRTYGPFFSGLTERACKMYGGTYCPITDCSNLKTCVEQYIQEATDEGLVAYKDFLELAPQINETDSTEQCYAAREYFGFEGNFINDLQICRDISQMRYVEDFDFLNEFFDLDPADGPDAPKKYRLDDDNELTEPSTAISQSEAFKGASKWKEVNMRMEQVLTAITFAKDIIAAFKCPDDPFGITQTVCATVTNTLHVVMSAIVETLSLIHKLSKYLQSIVTSLTAGQVGESFEDIKAISTNVLAFGKFIANPENGIVSDSTSGRNLLPSNNIEPTSELNTCDKTNSGTLNFQVQVVNKLHPAKVLIVSTLHGKSIDPDIAVKAYHEDGTFERVSFSATHLELGTTLLELESNENHFHFTVTAKRSGGLDEVKGVHVLSLVG